MLSLLMGWKGYVAAAGAGAIVAGLAVGIGQGWRHDAAISAMVATHAQVMQGYADAAAEASEKLVERQAAHQVTVAVLDAKHTEELTNANAEIDRLRADVAAGHRRLRVNAECPAPAAGLSAATGPTGLDDEAGPRLTGAAERDYFALRERIARSDAMIKGLQEYIQSVCLGN